MKYKLVCSDIDGTLIAWNGTLPEENRKAIQDMQEKGIIFAISTGRMYCSAAMLCELIGIQSYIISGCGMTVESQKKGEFLVHESFPADVIEKFIGLGEKFEICSSNFHFDQGLIMNSKIGNYEYDVYQALNDKAVKAGLNRQHLTELIEDPTETLPVERKDSFNKVALWMPDEQKKQIVLDYVKKYIPEVEPASGMPENIEITPKGITKWTGIEAIMKKHGIKPEEVVCIGDSMNDADMIQRAGLGVAMGNSLEELKELADVITDTNDNAGFAKAIYQYVLNETC